MAEITVTRTITVPDGAPEQLEELRAAATTLAEATAKRDDIMRVLKSSKVRLGIIAECADLSVGQVARILNPPSKDGDAPEGDAKPEADEDAATAGAGDAGSGGKPKR